MGRRTFAFTLAVEGVAEDDEDMIAKMRDFGLSDTVMEHRGGLVYLSFVREAPTPEAALDRAIAEIELSVTTTRVVKIVDDLLTIEEISRRMGMPGGLVRPLSDDTWASFPAPEGFTYSGTRLWRWSQVRHWVALLGHAVPGEIGEPLPLRLIYERNLRFGEDLRVATEPVIEQPPKAIDPAESAAAEAIDEIFRDLEGDLFDDLDDL